MTAAPKQPGKPPKKRTRRRRKDARPGEIIAAGLQEFAEKGFAGTRLDDVAARAGIAKGTIYLYFESKEALFEAAVRSRISPVFDQAVSLIDAYPGSSEALLRTILKTLYDQLIKSELPVLLRIMIADGPRFPRLTKFYYEEVISKGQAMLTKILDRGVARGEFRSGKVNELPMLVMAPGLMAALWGILFNTHQPVSLDAFREAHEELVFNALRPK